MGVSVESGGGRKMNFELNLVPFIDLLSVQITFLLATAVWVEIASLPVDQETGGGPAVVAEAPLSLHLPVTGVDWREITAAILADRRAHPDARDAVLATDDGVPYDTFIQALDLLRSHGYDRPVLAGG